MKLNTHILPYNLQFKKPATTSRGVYYHHYVWFVLISSPEHPEIFGIGECAPLPDLSYEYTSNYADCLKRACLQLAETGEINYPLLQPYPSILFGLETALLHLKQQLATGHQSWQLWQTDFSQSNKGIAINGLIWMNDFYTMQQEIEKKLEEGFRCIKLKVSTSSFQQDLELLARLRNQYPVSDLDIRLDANGAFAPLEAQKRLEQLTKYSIHSIEQPIAPEQWDVMAELIQTSPIPICLDEELIGVFDRLYKTELLEVLKPHYLILKPSLHGGIKGCQEWIELAENTGVKWWFTSALESNIGLNAIAQLASTYDNALFQGLGTGTLYHNNIPLPLYIQHSKLYFDNRVSTEFADIMYSIQHHSYDV